MARQYTPEHGPTPKERDRVCSCRQSGQGGNGSPNHGHITIKIQRRTYTILMRLVDNEAERMMKSVVQDGACDDCLEEFRKQIHKTEILHRAVKQYASSKGVSIA